MLWLGGAGFQINLAGERVRALGISQFKTLQGKAI
jgi:hypothetical protein